MACADAGCDCLQYSRLACIPGVTGGKTSLLCLCPAARLLEFHHAESLIKRYSASHATDLLLAEDVRWKWAGFGADKPTLVDGLSAVKGVALGGWHALVLVD